jgi:hypothetical protein
MRTATKVMIVGSGHRRERAVHPQSHHVGPRDLAGRDRRSEKISKAMRALEHQKLTSKRL